MMRITNNTGYKLSIEADCKEDEALIEATVKTIEKTNNILKECS